MKKGMLKWYYKNMSFHFIITIATQTYSIEQHFKCKSYKLVDIKIYSKQLSPSRKQNKKHKRKKNGEKLIFTIQKKHKAVEWLESNAI